MASALNYPEFLISAVLLLAVTPVCDAVLCRVGMRAVNFRGEKITVGLGIAAVLWSSFQLLWMLQQHRFEWRLGSAWVMMILSFGLLGFVDDRWGDRTSSGLKGHFRRFLVDGVITTGFLKAVGGFAVSWLVSAVVLQQAQLSAFRSALLIALCANSINLLDLRPGRAGSIFLLCAAPLVWFGWKTSGTAPPLTMVAAGMLPVYERDRGARAMMGDCGSNALGGALGLAVVTTLGEAAQWMVLGFVVLLHIVAERWSITRLISEIPLLSRLDRLTGVR
jgi:UDP-N-acetylmuramyl pentapeptide phosphotransferase/UDP-N-acetylglucosamine-1-phosphate transferase